MLAELRDIVREVGTAANLDDALGVVIRRIRAFVAVDACAVYLADVEADQWVLMASSGLESGEFARARTDRRSGLLGLVGERRELILITDPTRRPLQGASPDEAKGEQASFLGTPLIHYHNVLGILAAWKRRHAKFDEHEVAFFVTIAAQLAKLIHGAVAVDEVARLLRGEGGANAFIQGLAAGAGVAIGTALLVDPSARTEPAVDGIPRCAQDEVLTLQAAVDAARERLRAGSERLDERVPKEMRDLVEAHAMLLGSESLATEAIAHIRSGSSAASAWRETIESRAKLFDRMDDPYLRARADDVRAVGRDVLFQLQSTVEAQAIYPPRCVLVGDTIGVTEIAAVPIGRLVGIVCRQGSALSHTAVLARALGIPAVVSLPALPLGDLGGATVIVDGDQGRIHVGPTQATIEVFERRIAEERALAARRAGSRDLAAETLDGVRVSLSANIGLADDTADALRSGAEGVGLYRTEYQFLVRETFPVEAEQYEIYRRALEAFAPRPVTVRTLDVGGDKILPYFPVQEDNPFLGCRGIRFSLEHPEIFLIQLRALLRANAGLGNLQVLFPMIAKVHELDEALELLDRAHRELAEEGLEAAKAKVGAMIEVPSAVFQTKTLADRVDFLSVGTNDLTQYILAADRTNARVATPYDTLHPAVLDAVAKVVRDAHERRTPVTVCGEMAGDPAGALALLGMGIDALSMSAKSLPRVKLAIRGFTAERARALLAAALLERDGLAVHRLLNAALEEAGL